MKLSIWKVYMGILLMSNITRKMGNHPKSWKVMQRICSADHKGALPNAKQAAVLLGIPNPTLGIGKWGSSSPAIFKEVPATKAEVHLGYDPNAWVTISVRNI